MTSQHDVAIPTSGPGNAARFVRLVWNWQFSRHKKVQQRVAKMARRFELIGGAVAALVGVAVAGAVVALGGAAWAAGWLVLSGVGAGLGAYQHANGGGGSWLALLWASALGLLAMTVLVVFSVSILILPGTFAAFISAIAGARRTASGPAGG